MPAEKRFLPDCSRYKQTGNRAVVRRDLRAADGNHGITIAFMTTPMAAYKLSVVVGGHAIDAAVTSELPMTARRTPLNSCYMYRNLLL